MRIRNENHSFARFAIAMALALLPQSVCAQAGTAPPSAVQGAASQSRLEGTGPQPPPSSKEVGDALMMHQRYQAAIEAYKKVPGESAEVMNQMGIAYQMMFNLSDATKCYQASLRINPRNSNVLNNLGTVYDSLKEYGDAERMYRKALKIDPKSALTEKNLGTSLMSQHHYKQGWQAYQAALALDPQIFQASGTPRVENGGNIQDRGAMNYYMAKGCVRAGQSDRAIEYLRLALNEGFTNPKKIQADSEFASLHGLPAFEQLLAAQGAQ
jgi:tetratricopeptide (TPR) repeat protein